MYKSSKKWCLIDEDYPEARALHLVMDNLYIHTPAAFYKAFPAAEAHRLAQRVRFHYTPKHESWLNMAEIELSVLSRQVLAERMPDLASVEQAVTAWEKERNQAQATVHWRFTTPDARIKLRRLYPSFES